MHIDSCRRTATTQGHPAGRRSLTRPGRTATWPCLAGGPGPPCAGEVPTTNQWDPAVDSHRRTDLGDGEKHRLVLDHLEKWRACGTISRSPGEPPKRSPREPGQPAQRHVHGSLPPASRAPKSLCPTLCPSIQGRGSGATRAHDHRRRCARYAHSRRPRQEPAAGAPTRSTVTSAWGCFSLGQRVRGATC